VQAEAWVSEWRKKLSGEVEFFEGLDDMFVATSKPYQQIPKQKIQKKNC
jgi:hypothetical protein